MLVAKKERPSHKYWWQTKNGCPNQASKQLTPNERKTKPQKLVANEKGLPPYQASKEQTPNERNKTAETTSKT